jgi:hypothetical protein
MTVRSVLPVMPYSSAIPNSKIEDDTALSTKNLRPASLERSSRFAQVARKASESDETSSDR